MGKRFMLAAGLLLGIFFFPTLAQAQNATVGKSASGRTITTSVTPLRAGMVMRNGKVVEVKGKDFTPLAQARTFPNGATLQPNGAFKTASGEIIQLNEGDHVDLKGTFHRSVVVTNSSTTLSGDTAGLGRQLLQAQQMKDRLRLLQEKQRVLQQKTDLLQKTVQNKPAQTELKKLDADLAKLQQQLAAEGNKQ